MMILNHHPLRWLLPAVAYGLAALMLIGCDRGAPQPEFIRKTEWIDSGVWMKVDTHLHTTFSDGAYSVSVVAAKAREFGCDAIAITDHGDQNLKAASLEYAEAIEVARREHPELLILAGLEWNVPPWKGDTHATVLMPGGPDEFLHLADFKSQFDDFERKDPGEEHLAAQALHWLDAVETADGSNPVVILNHPSRKTGSISEAGQQLQTMLEDSRVTIGFEGAPGHQKGKQLGAYTGPVMPVDRWDPVAAENGGVWDQQLGSGSSVWGALATSDFHQEGDDYWPGEFSETWVYAPDRTSAGVLSALRAGSFFSAHGHIVRDVSLTVTTDGLSRPAAAGEVIQVAAGASVDVRLTAHVPELDWSGQPNHLDAVELIVVTPEGTRSIEIANTPSSSDRLDVLQRLDIPAGGLVVRARGRRNVADGPDLMFYTNPIRIQQSNSTSELRGTLSRQDDAGLLKACGLAGLLLLVPVCSVVWQIMQRRYVGGFSDSNSSAQSTFRFPLTRLDRAALSIYLGTILLAVVAAYRTIGDGMPDSPEVMVATAVAISGLLALSFVPMAPIVGLIVYAVLSYSLEREHVVCRAILDSATMTWVTLLTVLGCVVRLIRQRQVPRVSSHPLLWLVLAFMAWTGVSVIAAVVESRPLSPDLVERTDRLFQAFMMFLVAANFVRCLPDFRLFTFILGVMWIFRQRFFTTSTFLEQNLAMLVAISIPIVFFVARAAPTRVAQAFSFLIMAYLIRLVVVIQNRGAVLGLALSVCVLWLFSRHRWKLLAVAPFVLGIVIILIPDGLWQRFGDTYRDGAFHGSAAERMELWKAGLEIYADHPVFGVGPGNYGRYVGLYNPQLFNMGAHNSFVDVVSEMGAIGVILYTLMLLAATWYFGCSAVRHRHDWRGGLQACLVAAVWAHFGASFVLSAYSLVLFFILLGMGISFSTVPVTAVTWPRTNLPVRWIAFPQLHRILAGLPRFVTGAPVMPPAPMRLSTERTAVRDVFLVLTLVFVSIAICGSLVPFSFQPSSLASAMTRLTKHAVLHPDFSDFADWLSNISLFVPIGFFGLATATTGTTDGRRPLWKIAQVLLLCTWLSASIEFVQLWFPMRTVSLNDVLAETAGGLFGALLWIVSAQRVTNVVGRVMTRFRDRIGMWDGILCGYTVAFVLYSLYPLDLTINPAEVWAKYKSGRIVLAPFSQGFDSVSAASVSVALGCMVAIPAGMLAARFARLLAVRQVWSVTLLVGFGIIALIEVTRLIVASQTFATTNLILGGAGVVLGASTVHQWARMKMIARSKAQTHTEAPRQSAGGDSGQDFSANANSYPREIHDRVWNRNSDASRPARGKPSSVDVGATVSVVEPDQLTPPKRLLQAAFRGLPIGLTLLLGLLFVNRYVLSRSSFRAVDTVPTSADETQDRMQKMSPDISGFAERAVDPLQTPTSVEISIPDFPGSYAVWGATGADDRGHVWFGVSATDVETPSAHLFEYNPDNGDVTDRGSVVEELRNSGMYRSGEGQMKIHTKIVQGGDGHLYFASMDEEGEKEDGSQLPIWGSHLWRLRLPEYRWEHLAAVSEGLIAIDGLGSRIYSLGLFGQVLYQFDIPTEQLRSVRVGAVGGHISRNFVTDSRGHTFVPRVVELNHVDPAAPQSVRFRATLVEFNPELQEINETPIPNYLKYLDDHGITGFTHTSSGSILFLTSVGYLYRITPPEASSDQAAMVQPLGWFHPDGTAYSASLFTLAGERHVAGVARRAGHAWEWVVHDLESGVSTASPAEFAQEQPKVRDDLLLYGSATRDRLGDFYIAGRYVQAGRQRPILLRLKTQVQPRSE